MTQRGTTIKRMGGGEAKKRAMSESSLRLLRRKTAVALLLMPVTLAITIFHREWVLTAIFAVGAVVVALQFRWLRRYEPQPDRWIWKRRR